MKIPQLRIAGVMKGWALPPAAAFVVAAALLTPGSASAADASASPPQTSAKPAASKQKVYPKPEDAVVELVSATRGHQVSALVAVLGPDSAVIVSSGDVAADKAERERFVQSYDEARTIEPDGDTKAVLIVGKKGWPFPVLLVKSADGWRFDARAGREEVLNRRVGYNELSAIQAVLAYVDAQLDYYIANPQRLTSPAFAQRIISLPGKRDGLYFPTQAGEPESPLGPLFDIAPGPTTPAAAKAKPYFGYRYRILKAQGPDAPGGARDYVVNGRMIAGHALVAWPATYGNSGVMTFIVNQEGIVYETNLGPQTDVLARHMAKFNPDGGWRRVGPK